MDMSWVPSGYDPETAFRIEIKIGGYLNKQNVCRKECVKAKTVNWVVDSDRFSMCELMNDLPEEISWGSGQMPKIWGFDKNEGRDVMVSSESLSLDMFKMYEKEKKVTLLILVCDSEGSSHCSNTTPNYPCTPSQPKIWALLRKHQNLQLYISRNITRDYGAEVISTNFQRLIMSQTTSQRASIVG